MSLNKLSHYHKRSTVETTNKAATSLLTLTPSALEITHVGSGATMATVHTLLLVTSTHPSAPALFPIPSVTASVARSLTDAVLPSLLSEGITAAPNPFAHLDQTFAASRAAMAGTVSTRRTTENLVSFSSLCPLFFFLLSFFFHPNWK